MPAGCSERCLPEVCKAGEKHQPSFTFGRRGGYSGQFLVIPSLLCEAAVLAGKLLPLSHVGSLAFLDFFTRRFSESQQGVPLPSLDLSDGVGSF